MLTHIKLCLTWKKRDEISVNSAKKLHTDNLHLFFVLSFGYTVTAENKRERKRLNGTEYETSNSTRIKATYKRICVYESHKFYCE